MIYMKNTTTTKFPKARTRSIANEILAYQAKLQNSTKCRLSEGAIIAIDQAFVVYAQHLLKEAALLASRANRITLSAADIELALRNKLL